MAIGKIENLFIVGAGFSSAAGLPLTSELTEKLLDVSDLKDDGPSALQVEYLKKFVSDTFECSPNTPASDWPQLEDIFTCIDLSANTGHHLGPNYSPSQLRTARRALIVRIIRMLRYSYTRERDNPGPKWKLLEKFFNSIDARNSAFLSMNWDTVIESGLARTQKISDYDYGCDALRAEFAKLGPKISVIKTNPKIQILKPHGSANWLYCDACRRLFWFNPTQNDKIASQLFRDSDWDVVKVATGREYAAPKLRKCPKCAAAALGTRFATFSYRKALDFPMHEDTWRSAEKRLQEASNWVFIGYSLPGADYEFKLLLKRVMLSRKVRPKLILVTGGPTTAVEQTRTSYQKFFGNGIDVSETVSFGNGLDRRAIEALQKMGALKLPSPPKIKLTKKRR